MKKKAWLVVDRETGQIHGNPQLKKDDAIFISQWFNFKNKKRYKIIPCEISWSNKKI